jgi:glutaredoxin
VSSPVKFVLFVAVLFAAWHFSGGRTENVAAKLAPGNEVVMYSLTTCGYCTQKRGQLTAAGIPFTEIFLDKDEAQHRKFGELLAAHNVPPGGVGTPSFMVNGELMLNNPRMDELKRKLKYKS